MDNDMFKILMQQFGIDPAVFAQMLQAAQKVAEQVDGFDARLVDISERLARIEAALIPPGGNDGKH